MPDNKRDNKKYFLPASSKLSKWINQGEEKGRQRGCRLRSWVYRWNGYWFDINWGMQKRFFPATNFEEENGQNLLFVMGLWRSGTTLLHNLLSRGCNMASPQTWQCMNPSSFLLHKRPQSNRKTAQRPMDEVIVSDFSPQEDEFVLLALGVPSVYRAWINPQKWEEILPALAQETWLNLPNEMWFNDWRSFLGWCMPVEAQMLVIKSPNHVFRLKAIHRRWPKAKYVWILRDPLDIWISNRKMWQAMMNRYALWEWRLEHIDQLLYHVFKEYINTLNWAVKKFSTEQMVVLSFNHLTKSPVDAMKNIIQKLNLGDWSKWQTLVEFNSNVFFSSPNPNNNNLPNYCLNLIDDIKGLHRKILDMEHL
jgi:omega-hydroxy-beta-dihydromenaquinone-9 sulfotransferase